MGVGITEIESVVGAIGRASAAAPVMIGDMVLTGLEVPDELIMGGRQELVVHRLLGGGRVIDTLGNDPSRLMLRGRFMGPEAQTRARMLERMRMAGAAVVFSAAGLSCQVWIAQFQYAYEAKGALCSYCLELERAAEQVSDTASSESSWSNDVGNALSTLTSFIGGVSSATYLLAGQVGTVVGQVTPLATMVGAGRMVAKVSDVLGMVNGISQAGVDLATSPASVASMLSGLRQAGTGLTSVLSETGTNLEGIDLIDSNSLSALTINAGLASMVTDTGGLLNRASANISIEGGIVSAATDAVV